MHKSTIIILGKLPPPYYGPAIATEILLNSTLKDYFYVVHHRTNLNEDVAGIGTVSFRKLPLIILGYLKLIARILKHRPQLVLIPVSQSTPGFIKDSIFILISKTFFLKVVLHLRGSNFKNWLGNTSKPVQFYVRFIMHLLHGAIVLGNNLKYLFEGYLSMDKIFVVPNGANYHFCLNRKENNIPRILYLSNLQPSKGIEDVIDAAVILKKLYKREYTLDIVGAWRERTFEEKCRTLCQEANIPVKFHPPANSQQKKEYFEAADIFIFVPRAPEGHPWVIVEALAAGLPIIATDQGAIIESVVDNSNGFIVDIYSPAQIAEKIDFLIEHTNIRLKMGRTSYKHYLKNFTEEKMIGNLSECFNAIITT